MPAPLPPEGAGVMVPVNSIISNPRNDNIHPVVQLERIGESLKLFGQPKPILVRQENRMIIAGEGVWRGAQHIGWTEIKVLFWDVDQKTADAFLVADNQLSTLSHIDQRRRRELLAELEPEEFGNFAALGFGADEVEKLFADVADEKPIEVVTVDTADVRDTFWINIVGPLSQQAYAIARLRELMADIPGVEVQLGTTPGV